MNNRGTSNAQGLATSQASSWSVSVEDTTVLQPVPAHSKIEVYTEERLKEAEKETGTK